MRRRLVIGLGVFFIAVMMIFFMFMPQEKDRALETIAVKMSVNQENQIEEEDSKVITDLIFSNFSILEDELSDKELTYVKQRLVYLFVDYFPEISDVRIELPRYFEKYEEDILTYTGVGSLDSFMLLYRKLSHLPAYGHVELLLEPVSMDSDVEYARFKMTAIYDGLVEVDYFVSLNRETMEFKIH